MDVDHPAVPILRQPRGQDAHVPRQHHYVRRLLGEQRSQRALLRLARSVADGEDVVRHTEARRELSMRLVVRDDERDLARQLAERGTYEEIAEAVSLLR